MIHFLSKSDFFVRMECKSLIELKSGNLKSLKIHHQDDSIGYFHPFLNRIIVILLIFSENLRLSNLGYKFVPFLKKGHLYYIEYLLVISAPLLTVEAVTLHCNK